MKRSIRALSALLLAAVLGTSAAVTVSAKEIFVSPKGASTVVSETAPAPKKTETPSKPQAPVEGDGFIITGGAPVFKSGTVPSRSYVVPVVPQPTYVNPWGYGWYRPQPYDIIRSGKYYSIADAKAEIEKYLDRTAYRIIMTEGEKRTICDGAYYVSTDPSVAYYDTTSGRLVARRNGSAQIYVYTQGGVPITRLDVNVLVKSSYEKLPDVLYVSTDAWNIAIDGSTLCSVKSASGKTYKDVLFKVIRGADYGRVGEENGKISGKDNGAVIVRAYSKSNPDVYGDVLVYVGSLTAAIYDGCWSTCKEGVCVTNWGYDVNDIIASYAAAVNGWIRSAEGIFIPVIRLSDAVRTNEDGTKEPTKVLYSDELSYLDLLRMAYGRRSDLSKVIAAYNVTRYGTDKIVVNPYDERTLLLAQILGLLD